MIAGIVRAAARRTVVTALVAFSGGSAAVAAQQHTVTLGEAVDLALKTNPTAVAAAGAVDNAEARMLEVRGAFLPSLTLNSTYSNSSNQRFDQASGQLVSESFTAQTQASYDIFQGGRKWANYRSASASARSAEAAYRAQRFQTATIAKSAYWAAAAASELVGVAQQRLERAHQQRSFADARLEVGTATRSDVLRAELEEANAEAGLIDAEAAVRSARLALGRLVGFEGEVAPADPDLPETAPALPPREELAAMAEASSPNAISARALYDEAKADRLVSYTSYIPTLRATGGYDWIAATFPPDKRSWSLRLVASLPVFNGLQREAAVSRAAVTSQIAASRARDAALGARVLALDAAQRIESAERRVAIARRAVELAREDLRVQEERYQIDAATIIELQTSQVAVSDAEASFVTARQQLGVAIAQLEAVLGEDIRVR
jgi:outer membrane protein TolC